MPFSGSQATLFISFGRWKVRQHTQRGNNSARQSTDPAACPKVQQQSIVYSLQSTDWMLTFSQLEPSFTSTPRVLFGPRSIWPGPLLGRLSISVSCLSKNLFGCKNAVKTFNRVQKMRKNNLKIKRKKKNREKNQTRFSCKPSRKWLTNRADELTNFSRQKLWCVRARGEIINLENV